jgi:hypothetical protein
LTDDTSDSVLVDASGVVFVLLLPIVFAVVAALIVSRQPRNTIGWLLMTPAVMISVVEPLQEYLRSLAPTSPEPTLPLLLLVWFSGWSWILYIYPLLLISLLFPNGLPPTPRWRWIGLAAVVWGGIYALAVTLSQPLSANITPDLKLDNPIGVYGGIPESVGYAWVVGLWLIIALCVGSLFARYRRASDADRRQLKWLLFACAVFLVVYIILFTVPDDDSLIGQVWGLVLPLSLLGIPIAIGIAILRYRLFDIDLIINRALVYGTLTALVAGLYSSLVSLLVTVFKDAFEQPSLPAIVVVTLVVTAAFTPVKNRLQRTVDRVIPAEHDPAKDLKAFRDQVEMLRQVVNVEQLNAEGLLRRLLTETTAAYGADGGAVYLGTGSFRQLVHSVGDWPVAVGLSVALEHEGREIGLVVLGRRGNRALYGEQDEQALRQAAAAVSPLVVGRAVEGPPTTAG